MNLNLFFVNGTINHYYYCEKKEESQEGKIMSEVDKA